MIIKTLFRIKKPRQSGFTLIELLFVTIILGILAKITLNLIGNSLSISQFMNYQNADSASGRLAIQRISREIREVSTVNKIYQFTNYSPTGPTLTFTRTFMIGNTEDKSTSVTLAQSGSTITIQEGSNASPVVLVRNVVANSLVFNFFQANETSALKGNNIDTTNVNNILVSFSIKSSNSLTTTYKTRIALRNNY